MRWLDWLRRPRVSDERWAFTENAGNVHREKIPFVLIGDHFINLNQIIDVKRNGDGTATVFFALVIGNEQVAETWLEDDAAKLIAFLKANGWRI